MAAAETAPRPSLPKPQRRRRRWRVLGAALSLLVLLGLAAACGGSGVDAASGGSEPLAVEGDAPAQDLASDLDAARVPADGTDEGSEGGVAARVAPEGQLFIRTGTVVLVAEDLNAARAGVESLVRRYGGFLGKERTRNDRDGRTQETQVELRVPSQDFRALLSDLEDVGAVQRSSTDEEDVTTQVIDVDSRIRTQEVSLRRLRGFLSEARTVDAMIRLEGQIAQREADLASLRSQQDFLEDQTSLSTIQLTLQLPDPEPAARSDRLDEAGFLAGLSSGWQALRDVLVVGATIVGALIPFALALGLVGLPLLLWLRHARRRRPALRDPVAPTVGG